MGCFGCYVFFCFASQTAALFEKKMGPIHLEGLNLNPWVSLILEILNREVAKIQVAKSFFLQEDWCFFLWQMVLYQT